MCRPCGGSLLRQADLAALSSSKGSLGIRRVLRRIVSVAGSFTVLHSAKSCQCDSGNEYYWGSFRPTFGRLSLVTGFRSISIAQLSLHWLIFCCLLRHRWLVELVKLQATRNKQTCAYLAMTATKVCQHRSDHAWVHVRAKDPAVGAISSFRSCPIIAEARASQDQGVCLR